MEKIDLSNLKIFMKMMLDSGYDKKELLRTLIYQITWEHDENGASTKLQALWEMGEITFEELLEEIKRQERGYVVKCAILKAIGSKLTLEQAFIMSEHEHHALTTLANSLEIKDYKPKQIKELIDFVKSIPKDKDEQCNVLNDFISITAKDMDWNSFIKAYPLEDCIQMCKDLNRYTEYNTIWSSFVGAIWEKITTEEQDLIVEEVDHPIIKAQLISTRKQLSQKKILEICREANNDIVWRVGLKRIDWSALSIDEIVQIQNDAKPFLGMDVPPEEAWIDILKSRELSEKDLFTFCATQNNRNILQIATLIINKPLDFEKAIENVISSYRNVRKTTLKPIGNKDIIDKINQYKSWKFLVATLQTIHFDFNDLLLIPKLLEEKSTGIPLIENNEFTIDELDQLINKGFLVLGYEATRAAKTLMMCAYLTLKTAVTSNVHWQSFCDKLAQKPRVQEILNVFGTIIKDQIKNEDEYAGFSYSIPWEQYTPGEVMSILRSVGNHPRIFKYVQEHIVKIILKEQN